MRGVLMTMYTVRSMMIPAATTAIVSGCPASFT
jgi:hypothetical protein